MAQFHGSGGKVLITAADIDATGWSLDTSLQTAEVTELGDTWASHVGGFVDWEASVDCILKSAPTVDPTSYLGATADLKLYVTAAEYWEASSICTGAVLSNASTDSPRITYSFTGTDGTAGMVLN